MSKLPAPGSDPYTYPNHSGVDFLRGPAHNGKPIRASGPGKALRTPYTARGGYWTTIQYDNGALIGYAHQNYPPPVKAGQRVAEGLIIGYVGSKGTNVTGPHVHVENLNNPTDTGIWQVFDRNRTIGSSNKTQGDDTDMIINIKGKRGKRRGGLYYVTNGKAAFIGGRMPLTQGRYPMFTNEKEIKRLQDNIDGLK